jgi:S1-C subfamily serine protease
MVSSILISAASLLAASSSPAQADDAVAAILLPNIQLHECSTKPPALPEGTADAQKAVLAVTNGDSIGSTVMISSSGTALTAAHVVDGADTVTVRTVMGLELDAEVLWRDDEADVAVIESKARATPACRCRLSGWWPAQMCSPSVRPPTRRSHSVFPRAW